MIVKFGSKGYRDLRLSSIHESFPPFPVSTLVFPLSLQTCTIATLITLGPITHLHLGQELLWRALSKRLRVKLANSWFQSSPIPAALPVILLQDHLYGVLNLPVPPLSNRSSRQPSLHSNHPHTDYITGKRSCRRAGLQMRLSMGSRRGNQRHSRQRRRGWHIGSHSVLPPITHLPQLSRLQPVLH